MVVFVFVFVVSIVVGVFRSTDAHGRRVRVCVAKRREGVLWGKIVRRISDNGERAIY